MKGTALELALYQALALGLALGGEILERFAPKMPQIGGPIALITDFGYMKWLGLGFALTLNLLFIVAQRKSMVQREADARNRTIDSLYAELRQLMSQTTPGADSEIEERLTRLRLLQLEEAAAMRQRYEARRFLKTGAGWQALSEARKLLSENENPSSSNPTLRRQA
jgi:hypothetical protein